MNESILFFLKKIISVVKNAPFQFCFEHEMLHVSCDRKLVPDIAIKPENHHCSCFFYLQKQQGSLMFWKLDPDMKKKHEWMKETGLSLNLSKNKQCQKNCERLEMGKKIIWCPNNLLGYLCLSLSLSYSTKINLQKNNSEHD